MAGVHGLGLTGSEQRPLALQRPHALKDFELNTLVDQTPDDAHQIGVDTGQLLHLSALPSSRSKILPNMLLMSPMSDL